MPSSVTETKPIRAAGPTDDPGFDDPRNVVDRRPRLVVVSDWLVANPLVAPALGMTAGIFFDAWHAVGVGIACLVFAAAGLLVWRSTRWHLAGPLGLFIAAAATGTVLHDLSFRRWPARHLVRHASDQAATVRLSGTVLSSPLIQSGSSAKAVWYPELPRTRFILSADTLVRGGRRHVVEGLVTVTVREPLLDAGAGDRVELFGTLRRIGPPANPGSIDWSLVNRRNGVLVEFRCRRAADVRVRASNPWQWRTWLDWLRQRARAAMLDGTYPGDVPGSGLLAGMVLGQRSAIDADLNEAFVRSGTVHYLSVSGAHVGMLVGAVWAIGTFLGIGRRRFAAWAMTAATGYAVLAEPSAPIIRAAIMTDLACLALLARRPVRAANCLALSALVLLVMRPTQLFNAGFQLSYVTLLSVIYVSPRVYYAGMRAYRRLTRRDDPLLAPEMQQRLGMRSPIWAWWDRAVRSLGGLVAVGLAASAVGALLSAYHFHQVQCWGWINTIVLVPFVWFVMVVGLIKPVVAGIVPWLSDPLGWALATVTDALIELVEAMARLPAAAFATPAIPPWIVASGLLLVVLWTVQDALRIPPRCCRLAGLAFAVAVSFALAPPSPRPSLTMHVLAVGNGTSTVIGLPNSKTLLYDAGCFPPYDLERWTLGPLLSRERCWRIDATIISHANLDHYAALPELLDRRWVARVITTPHFEHAGQAHSTSRELIARLRGKPGLWQIASRGDRLSGTGEAQLEVLWPPAEEITPGDTNETSLVLRISYGGKRILACGDIEEYAIRRLLATTDLRADVLLLPHHGSVTPFTAAFVRAVDPQYCIRSTGRRETSPALAEIVAGRTYFSTANDGAIEVRIERGALTVAPACRQR